MAILRIKNPDTGLWEEIVAIQGDSAYETALKHGFVGTEEEWLNSLKPEIEQELGTNPEAVMSQSATTNALNKRLEKGLNGTVTILADEWADSTPTEAAINMREIDDGDLIIITPANDDTFNECSQKHIHINNLELDTDSNTLVMLRCNEGLEVPKITLKFDYQIIKANFPSGRAVAQLSGIDYEAVVYNTLGDNSNIAISQKAVSEALAQKANIKYEELVDTLINTDEKQSVRTIAENAAGGVVTNHNTDSAAHNDIRLALEACQNKVNEFLDVDEATKTKLSEVLTMIANAEESGEIEQLTISKVNVSDIVDDLVTNDSKKVLSAAQGVVINNSLNVLNNNGADANKSVRTIANEVVESDGIKKYLLDMFYPVGSLAMNRDSNWDPAVAWGGTWYRIEGKFLVGARADAKEGEPYYVDSVGGSEIVTLEVENLPPHTHFIGDENYTLIGSEGSAESTTSRGIKYTTNGRGSTLRTNQSSECYGKAFSILPPYTAVYMWYRTA